MCHGAIPILAIPFTPCVWHCHQIANWIRGMCRICTKCLGFENSAERLFYCRYAPCLQRLAVVCDGCVMIIFRRCFHHKWLHGPRPPITERMQSDMAVKIQRRWRAKHARRLLLEALEQVYQKIRDPDTGAYYYFNTRTGVSTWTKPRLLGSSDLPETYFHKGVVRSNTVETPVDGPDAATSATDEPPADTADCQAGAPPVEPPVDGDTTSQVAEPPPQ